MSPLAVSSYCCLLLLLLLLFAAKLSNDLVLSEAELLSVLNFLLSLAERPSLDIGLRQQALSPIQWAAKQKPRGNNNNNNNNNQQQQQQQEKQHLNIIEMF